MNNTGEGERRKNRHFFSLLWAGQKQDNFTTFSCCSSFSLPLSLSLSLSLTQTPVPLHTRYFSHTVTIYTYTHSLSHTPRVAINFFSLFSSHKNTPSVDVAHIMALHCVSFFVSHQRPIHFAKSFKTTNKYTFALASSTFPLFRAGVINQLYHCISKYTLLI